MTYPFIPIGLIAIYIVYVLYLLIVKKDIKKLTLFCTLDYFLLLFGVFFISFTEIIISKLWKNSAIPNDKKGSWQRSLHCDTKQLQTDRLNE